MEKKPTIKTLKNGLRVVVVPQPNAATVTTIVFVGVGAAYESKAQNGLSHFLEHMCFKGTSHRPNAAAISNEIESLGAVSNAFTDYEMTGYYIKGNPEHSDTFTDILADIYKNSTFPELEIQKEKGVIIEEINMYEDMPQHKVYNVLFELLYKDQPIGRTILGTKESVSSFSNKDFVSYKDAFYTAANTVVVLAGNITAKKGVAIAEKYFKDIPRSSKNKKKKVMDIQRSAASALFQKKTDQAHFVLAFRALPLGHSDLPALTILSTILGGGMSSRLFLAIREELGAAYYIHSFPEVYLQNGLFCIAAGIDKNRLKEIIKRIIEECRLLKNDLVSSAELAKAKEYSIGTLRRGLEVSNSVASFYGAQLVLDQKLQTPEQKVKALKAVTAKNVQRVAKKIFQQNRLNLAIVGPYTNKEVPKELFLNL